MVNSHYLLFWVSYFTVQVQKTFVNSESKKHRTADSAWDHNLWIYKMDYGDYWNV